MQHPKDAVLKDVTDMVTNQQGLVAGHAVLNIKRKAENTLVGHACTIHEMPEESGMGKGAYTSCVATAA